ncbi:hypothetical protein GCM10020367_66420 [Streptomyces sannanensis]|uniref:Uncharacterized protein n=1 Tax=Streptomyces sannanensis TaxID=285536 RepID=A0ABP6S4U9_9ACTN
MGVSLTRPVRGARNWHTGSPRTGGSAFDGKAADELGRILRYWAGNLHHCALDPGDGCAVYDSGYREVGRWSITGLPAKDA